MDACMSASLCILASGSSGNASAISFDGSGRFILVDAGLSPSRVRVRLAESRGPFERLRAILLTHLEDWGKQLARSPVPVLLRREHAAEAVDLGVPAECITVIGESARLGDAATVRACAVPHDEVGSTAYRFDCAHGSIGFATDLGRVTDELHAMLEGVDTLAIESNYDPAMQMASPRPAFLKRRIMGGAGHLSNEQSTAAASIVAESGRLANVAFIHLSRDCNAPHIVESLARERLAGASCSIVVSTRERPTALMQVSRAAAASPAPPKTHPIAAE
jgi:phosphoribosyl 1,2-cyclic phosphodiesterase